MQGAFVFNQEYDNFLHSFLVMYKEISKEVIFYLIYGNKYLKYNYITIFDFYYLFGNVNNYLHIINYLPFHYNINITMNLWKSIAFNRLKEFY